MILLLVSLIYVIALGFALLALTITTIGLLDRVYQWSCRRLRGSWLGSREELDQER